MNENHDKAWKDLAKRARAGERHVVGGKDAERLLRALPDEGMSETEVDAIVRGVVAGRAPAQSESMVRSSKVAPVPADESAGGSREHREAHAELAEMPGAIPGRTSSLRGGA